MPYMKVTPNKRVYTTEMCHHLHRFDLVGAIWCSQCGAVKLPGEPWLKSHLKAHKRAVMWGMKKV